MSVCLYIVGALADAAAAAERLGGVHDGLLRMTGAVATLTPTRPR